MDWSDRRQTYARAKCNLGIGYVDRFVRLGRDNVLRTVGSAIREFASRCYNQVDLDQMRKNGVEIYALIRPDKVAARLVGLARGVQDL